MNHNGRLIVTSEGVQFEPFVTSHNRWKVSFNRINRVEKVSVTDTLNAISQAVSYNVTFLQVNTIAQIGSGKDLLILGAEGLSYSASNVAKRDEVFTQIVGYSKVRWQVVG